MERTDNEAELDWQDITAAVMGEQMPPPSSGAPDGYSLIEKLERDTAAAWAEAPHSKRSRRSERFSFPGSYERTPLGDFIDKSTMKLLKAAFDAAGDKNVVSSPLGLMLLLSLYNCGAGAGSREEINRLLGGTDYQQLFESYSSLSRQFSEMDPAYFTLANKVYVAAQCTPAEQFAAAARSYRSEVESLDFTKRDHAANVINKWASEKTRGNISSPVSADSLDADTAAALFNVVFFKGHWDVPFKAANTKDKDFHVDAETTVKKPTMHLLESLFYTSCQELGARMIELPYKEKGFRMVVVLPNEVDGLPAVLEKAAEKGLLTDVFNLRPAGRHVVLDLPKFEVRSKQDFKDILAKVEVSNLFTEPSTGVVKEKPVQVSKAFQEAFIKIDEEGATAGAFTGVVEVLCSIGSKPPRPLKFTVDRPFLYLILFEDKILFAGTYTH